MYQVVFSEPKPMNSMAETLISWFEAVLLQNGKLTDFYCKLQYVTDKIIYHIFFSHLLLFSTVLTTKLFSKSNKTTSNPIYSTTIVLFIDIGHQRTI